MQRRKAAERVPRVCERCLELAHGLHSLGVGDEHVVGVEDEGEEAPLVWVANANSPANRDADGRSMLWGSVLVEPAVGMLPLGGLL